MKKSMEMMLIDVKFFNNLLPASPIYDNLQEPTKIHELDNILSDETHIHFIGSIYCEHILGSDHNMTLCYLRITMKYVSRQKI